MLLVSSWTPANNAPFNTFNVAIVRVCRSNDWDNFPIDIH